jgi:hypothetical protein
MWRWSTPLLGVAGIILGLNFAAAEDWLPPGSSTIHLGEKPGEFLNPNAELNNNELLGRLLFRSPEILGEKAVRIGLSCDSCHTNGHINTSFYIKGLSDRPGRIDVSNEFWQAGFEDGINNPLDIPSLRGVKETAPYGTQAIFPDLAGFTRHVTETEFAGPRLTEKELRALVAYLSILENEPVNSSNGASVSYDTISYIPLLLKPVHDQDYKRIDRLIDLIRADIGRNVTEENLAASRQTISKLIDLRQSAATGDYKAVAEIYRSLDQ